MSTAKVSPSILSADFVNMERDVRALAEWGADYVHCDVMDGVYVKNLTFGMPMIAAIKKISPLPLDVHLMITEPERYVEAFADAGADIIMFDNMDNATMAEAVKLIGGKAKTEASGNMSIPRLKEVAATGVDYISVGALTHSVTALDISMNITQD